jgi:alpha-1,3/alpha-1,6-mannosyltransferase
MVRIVFIHPDLGIGGAERLVIDAALALKSKNHNVNIVTSHHEVNHCFIETRNGNLNVISVGDWLPRTLFGKCAALCATIRMFWAAFYLTVMSDLAPEVIICDQISNAIPILRFFSKAKIIFYCHFPDMLLTQRKSLMKKLYRKVMDYMEEYTTGKADLILVNSHFTKGEEIFRSSNYIS